MTTFYLVRHALNDHILGNVIAGWSPGVQLNEAGRRQANLTAEMLSSFPIQRIYSSPLERARETALPLASKLSLEVQVAEAIGELRFGEWTGKNIRELDGDRLWRKWNSCRSVTRAPGGDLMLETQCRFITFVEKLRAEFPGDHIALFSHGDPIRAAVLYYLGMPLDFLHRIEISLASVTIIRVGDDGPQLVCLNCLPPALFKSASAG
jgi:broad specificity phosphatase PhoE